MPKLEFKRFPDHPLKKILHWKSTVVSQRNVFIQQGNTTLHTLGNRTKARSSPSNSEPSKSPGNDVVVEGRVVFRDRRDEGFWLPLFNQFFLFLQKKGSYSVAQHKSPHAISADPNCSAMHSAPQNTLPAVVDLQPLPAVGENKGHSSWVLRTYHHHLFPYYSSYLFFSCSFG